MKKISKLFFIVAMLILIGTIKTYATDEEGDADVPSQADTVAPVFSSNIKTRYVVKKAEDEEEFNPSEVIKGIKATDNVDGSNVKIEMLEHNVDITRDGVYQVLYTATDNSGNMSVLVIEVLVDGIAPTFEDGLETTYYMNKAGIITDSKHNIIDSLPKTLTAKDSAGAFCGIGVRIYTDINGNIVVLDTIQNTPAEEVIKPNDIIIGVDGEDFKGKTADYAASVIKGEDGTAVELEIIRNSKTMTVTIVRDLIKVYEEEEKLAEPDVDITSIDLQSNGKIEITYTATDEAGNTATFTITVIEEPEEDVIVDNKKEINGEKLEKVTTGENPPADTELPEEKTDTETLETKESTEEEKVETTKNEAENSIEDKVENSIEDKAEKTVESVEE